MATVGDAADPLPPQRAAPRGALSAEEKAKGPTSVRDCATSCTEPLRHPELTRPRSPTPSLIASLQVKRTVAVPKHLFVYPAVAYLFYSLWRSGWLPYVAAYYAIYPFFSPFGNWGVAWRIFKRLLSGPFPGYHWSFNLSGGALLIAKLTLMYPIETLLWQLDNLLFPAHRQQEVRKPLFLLGQPRSGTTRFEDILSEDKESLVALSLFEMRYPYLTVQYAFDGVNWFDKKFLRGALRYVAFDVLDLNKPFGGKGDRHQMRRLQYELTDEDDILFLFHQMHHFQLCGMFPDEEFVRFFYHFDQLPERDQDQALAFHRQCVQKVLYRRGQGRNYFAKWVAGWNGQLARARRLYPDAQYIVIVRSASESLPSWFKLQGLLAKDLVGEDVMERPHLHRFFKEENLAWFKNEIEFCRSVPLENLTVLDSDQFYRDIQGDVRKVYEYLGREIAPGSDFDKFLARTQQKQVTHRKTKTDESHITQAEIRDEFPDLFKEILAIPGVHSVHAGLTPVSAKPTPLPTPSPAPSPAPFL